MSESDKSTLAWVLLVGVLIVVGVGGCSRGCLPDYSDGERTGVITKISHRGVIWKTDDGYLNLGGVASGANGAVVPNVFEFTVQDAAILEQVKKASKDGCRVTLTYRQWGIKPIWLDEDSVVVRLEVEK